MTVSRMKMKIEETGSSVVPSIIDLDQPKDDEDMQEVCYIWDLWKLSRNETCV